ncbi:MAG: 2-oxoacid:acceptor oxidoreductase family protein [Pseudomonadota bacterium]|nr:2-oxoacid:acceptor oxidoreductase family protein [Pseudomonadota bacterium]
MYRIRFHGRGGQGMKTASRMLGTAFFLEGFEIQDAPRYGAERRGAPIFAYVRAAATPVQERGVILHPDLVIVADDSLIPVPAAGVLAGVEARTVLLISTSETADKWRRRLNVSGPVLTLPEPAEIEDRLELRYVGAECAGAAARLTGVISGDALQQAVRNELSGMVAEVVEHNIEKAMEGYERMAEQESLVAEGAEIAVEGYRPPDWVEVPFEGARVSAPSIHAALTSEKVKTGLWRTMRPVIDHDLCKGCWWICSSGCPDGAISVDADRRPQIDYDHCKGCLICSAICPPHAISIVPEQAAELAKN